MGTIVSGNVDLPELIAEHRPFVRASLLHLGVARSWVDDAEQEVFLVVIRRRDAFDPTRGRSMRGWVWGICRNVASAHRKAARRRAKHEPMELGSHPPMDDRVAAAETLSMLDAQSRALWLARCEGRSALELARVLELPMTTVQWRLRQAKRAVASALRDVSRQGNLLLSWLLRPQRGLAPLLPCVLGIVLGRPQPPKPPPRAQPALPSDSTGGRTSPATARATPVRAPPEVRRAHVVDLEPTIERRAKPRRRVGVRGRVSMGDPSVQSAAR